MIPVGTNLRVDDLPRATLALIAVNFMVFIFEMIIPGNSLNTLINVFGYGPPNWYNPFAMVTSLFLHGDVGHIVFNMLFLWIFGGPLEVRVGSKRFLIYYLCTGAAAAIVYCIAGALSARFYGQPTVAGIGASGAISGVMGLYLYRCYFSQVRMTIPIIFLPIVTKFDFNLPAAPLMLFWFLKDVFFEIETFKGAAFTGVGHWAHIGGFTAGMVLAHVMKYGHEGRIKHLRQKIMDRLAGGGGWEAAESELKALHEIAPADAEVNHDLARLYLNRNRKAVAERHFRTAIESALAAPSGPKDIAMKSASANPSAGAYMLMEYSKAFNKPMPVGYHLRAAEALVAEGLIDEARKTLLVSMRTNIRKTPASERALALFTEILWDLGRKDEAKRGWSLLLKIFPSSKLIPEVKKAVSKKPGTLFTSKSKPAPTASEQKSIERRDAGLGTLDEIMSTISDPRFIITWFAMNIVVGIYGFLVLLTGRVGLALSIFSPLGQLAVFLLTLLAVLDRKFGLVTGWFERRHQAKLEAEFDLKRTLEKALAAERNGLFEDAASHYEQYLSHDASNLSTRSSLAKLYHRKLDNAEAAVRHARILLETTNPETPIHDEAQRIMQERGEPV